MSKQPIYQGEVSWPVEEAILEANHFEEIMSYNEYSNDELCQRVIKLRQHWIKVFDNDADMKEFSHEFNSRIADKINFYM